MGSSDKLSLPEVSALGVVEARSYSRSPYFLKAYLNRGRRPSGGPLKPQLGNPGQDSSGSVQGPFSDTKREPHFSSTTRVQLPVSW